MLKVTALTIKKAIKELGLNIDNFEINKNELETALENTDKGNKEVKKVVKYLSNKGADYHAFKTGYGAWFYRFERKTYSQELASMNID